MREICTGILAHADAGKTTCIESFFARTGVIRTRGRVDHGDSVFDNDPKEREHGITIYSKEAGITWKDTRINVIDTPGHVDFSGEMERVLSVLDLAVVLISGLDGVQPHTVTIMNCLAHYHVPLLFFVNKMDIARRSREDLLSELQNRFGECIDWNAPDGEEAIAMVNDPMMNAFLETGSVPDHLKRLAVSRRECFPVFFGSALKDEGIGELLDAIAQLSEPLPLRNEFGARVFKITNSPEGRLAHLRVTGGTLYAKQALNETEKADRIRILNGASYEIVTEAHAGAIAVVSGTKTLEAGSGLGFEEDLEPPMIEPCLSYTLEVSSSVDQRALFEVCRRLAEEDPTLAVSSDETTGAVHISIMGEMQKEILRYRIKEETGIDVAFGNGRIVYRETIRETAYGAGHFEPLRHFAEVHVRLEPGERDSGIIVSSECSTDDLPMHWQTAILTALRTIPHRGVLMGALLSDVKIILTAGKGHLKHTEGGDLRNASRRAVRQALMKTESILLEPYCRFEVTLAPEYLSRALYDFERREASVTVNETSAGVLLSGEGPMRTLMNSQADVIAYTRGTGRCVISPIGYRECRNPDPIIAESGYDAESDLRNPAGSVFCSHGSSFTVSWDQADAFMSIPVKDRTPEASYSHRTYHVGEDELKEIIASESGHNRNPNKQMRQTPEPEKQRPGKPQPVLPECLIVDGYNLLHLSDIDTTDISYARERLIDDLAAYQAYADKKVIAVFDGYRRQDNEGSSYKTGGLEVVYTRTGQTADAYIEKLVHDLKQSYAITVATSDALIQNSIFAQGAMRISSRILRQEIDQAKKLFLPENSQL